MNIDIRPRAPDDDPILVDIWNRTEPEYPPTTVEEVRFQIEHQRPDVITERWVAEADGTIVGSSGLYQQESGSFWGFLVVDVDRRREGIGGRLFDHLMERLTVCQAVKAYGVVHGNEPESLAFLERRGFTRTGLGERMARLEVRNANLAGFEDAEERLREQGIRIRTLAELGPDDDELMRRLYELDKVTHADIPAPEPWSIDPFDIWRTVYVMGYGRSPESCWVAMDGDRPVGLARLKRIGNAAWNAYTGVDREYRGRGIARALKYRTIEWSRQNGVEYHFTGNEAENERMVAINVSLGYEMLSRDIEIVKVLG